MAGVPTPNDYHNNNIDCYFTYLATTAAATAVAVIVIVVIIVVFKNKSQFYWIRIPTYISNLFGDIPQQSAAMTFRADCALRCVAPKWLEHRLLKCLYDERVQ